MTTTPKPFGQRRHWIFCSSGARTLYLENVVRALALPRGESIVYRYEEALVSADFKSAVATSTPFASTVVDGDIAYLCYLDNRDKAKPPTIYPVREATIRSVSVLGTTYVVQMDLECFVDWSVEPHLNQAIFDLAIDQLPHWDPWDKVDPAKNKAAGCWLAKTDALPDKVLVRYSESRRSHLKAFETTVRAISNGADFADGKRLFAIITGVYDVKRKSLLEGDVLRAGQRYDLHLYHFQAGDGTHNPLENFRLELTSDNEDVAIVGNAERYVEARYDEVIYSFRVKEDAKDGAVRLGVNVKRYDTGTPEPVYTLRATMKRRVASSKLRKIAFGTLIGVGLFGTQAVTLFATDKLTIMTFVLAFAFSLLAGMGASFQLKTKV